MQRSGWSQTKNTEEWDEKMKLGNQYRGLHTDELMFLEEKSRERRAAEREREEAEDEEVRNYREWVLLDSIDARALAAKHSAVTPSEPASSSTKRLPPKAVKKNVKTLLKGVTVKKKPKVEESKAVKEGGPVEKKRKVEE
jgi:hypothetical protein